MPVPKDIVRGQTVEIRCELKAEGKFDGTIYTCLLYTSAVYATEVSTQEYLAYTTEESEKLEVRALEMCIRDRYSPKDWNL